MVAGGASLVTHRVPPCHAHPLGPSALRWRRCKHHQWWRVGARPGKLKTTSFRSVMMALQTPPTRVVITWSLLVTPPPPPPTDRGLSVYDGGLARLGAAQRPPGRHGQGGHGGGGCEGPAAGRRGGQVGAGGEGLEGRGAGGEGKRGRGARGQVGAGAYVGVEKWGRRGHAQQAAQIRRPPLPGVKHACDQRPRPRPPLRRFPGCRALRLAGVTPSHHPLPLCAPTRGWQVQLGSIRAPLHKQPVRQGQHLAGGAGARSCRLRPRRRQQARRQPRRGRRAQARALRARGAGAPGVGESGGALRGRRTARVDALRAGRPPACLRGPTNSSPPPARPP